MKYTVLDTANPQGLATILVTQGLQALGHEVTDLDAAQVAILIGKATPDYSAQLEKLQIVLVSDQEVRQDAISTLKNNLDHPVAFNAQLHLASSAEQDSSGLKVVAVTACPTGVAHTFMSATALEEQGKKLGYQIKVETQGQNGPANILTSQEIADADLVIIAADIKVDLARFNSKKLYHTSTSQALKQTAKVYQDAVVGATISNSQGQAEVAPTEEKKGPYMHLMSGVSYMLPMVVAGGLLIALSFVFGIEAFKEQGTLAAALMQIGGSTAFALIIPLLSGYISYSIASRPGLTPGLIGGMLASSLATGFIGGIIAGFLAGYITKYLNQFIKLPNSFAALKPILILPFLSSLIIGLLMIYVISSPVASIMAGLEKFLLSMQASSAVLLGALIGAMMCSDLGGPINKAAYTFGVGLLASSLYGPMAAVMAAGMVPAIGMGLATFIARSKFTPAEREGGKASFLLGLVFISEGAIPFAARDPLKVIPCNILGGVITGAGAMLINAQLQAPHGGIFVLLIPNAITPVLGYLFVIALGSLVTGLSYSFVRNSNLSQA